MNRTFSTLAVLAMLLIATALCAMQTYDAREVVDAKTVTLLFAAEGLVAGLVIASAISVLRRRFARPQKQATRRQVPATV
jgi:uncharacterized protein YacL